MRQVTEGLLEVRATDINLKFSIENTGRRDARPFTVGFYASKNPNMTNPILIGRDSIDGLSTFSLIN